MHDDASIPGAADPAQVESRALADACAAVEAEQRAGVQNVLLEAFQVRPAGSSEVLFAIEVTGFASLDWTWEGARAIGLADEADAQRVVGSSSIGPLFDPEAPWNAEVIRVDEAGRQIFVAIDARDPEPQRGSFVIRPFDYLEALRALFAGDVGTELNARLTHHLLRAAGSTPEPVPGIPWAEGESADEGSDGDPAAPDQRTSASTAIDRQQLHALLEYDTGFLWGPPGTGKTFNLGELVADAALADPSERILVVSTTNRATDAAALSIARALHSRGQEPTEHVLRRMGQGADVERFREHALEHVLDPGAPELRDELIQALRQYRTARHRPERAAELQVRIRELRFALASGRGSLAEVDANILVTTAFLGIVALSRAAEVQAIAQFGAPFTTVVIDEAGLVSRAAAAALMTWSARRAILVGDPKQLSPISRMSRVLEPRRARWVAESGLTHIEALPPNRPWLLRLTMQFRMHPAIRATVSAFAYDNTLTDAPQISRRPPLLDGLDAPRPSQGAMFDLDEPQSAPAAAIWYVLDEDPGRTPAALRADRGPAGKSWVRRRSVEIIDRIFRAEPTWASTTGLFVTPFVAQARMVGEYLGSKGYTEWSASTTHAQQGAEADIVIFDTVHAGSTAWSPEEWTRLLNVGISRARHRLVVLANRAEASEPFLARLLPLLEPRALRSHQQSLLWSVVPAPLETEPHTDAPPAESLGGQLASRRSLRPLLSAEQTRLCSLPLDGKARLVRGVAGSGKTVVMAQWVARRLAESPDLRPLWIVYGNRAMQSLIAGMIESAWRSLGTDESFPWDRIELLHMLDLLDALELDTGLDPPDDRFDFEQRAGRLSEHALDARCQAMFIDEAQDCGESTLALLARLVQAPDPEYPEHRPIHVFFDNAQNVYGRGTPRWADFGLNLRGRSTVMKESFRSTRPITEFALNTLYRLREPTDDPDHKELVQRELIRQERRGGEPWWTVRFNEVDGPFPELHRFSTRTQETRAIAEAVATWIRDERVRPADIRVLANQSAIRDECTRELMAALQPLGVHAAHRTGDQPRADRDTVVVTTAHSFKGYEAEIIIVAAVDAFCAKPAPALPAEPLPEVLYVAMTRARSLLWISGTEPESQIGRATQSPGEHLLTAVASVARCQRQPIELQRLTTPGEDRVDLLDRIGTEHREWLEATLGRSRPRFGRILDGQGRVVAEPLFWFVHRKRRVVCLEEEPADATRDRLERSGVVLLRLGEPLRLPPR